MFCSDAGPDTILVLFRYTLARKSCLRWDDYDVYFVLDQHARLNFHGAISLEQQSVGRHVASLGHIIFILSKPILALSP